MIFPGNILLYRHFFPVGNSTMEKSVSFFRGRGVGWAGVGEGNYYVGGSTL